MKTAQMIDILPLYHTSLIVVCILIFVYNKQMMMMILMNQIKKRRLFACQRQRNHSKQN